jgi:hypothetical protein
MLCSASAPARADDGVPRPNVERPWPEAGKLHVSGKDFRCYEAAGDGWKAVGHLVVDYRAFFSWAAWAEGQLAARDAEIRNLEQQLAILRETATDAVAQMVEADRLAASEHQLRLEAEEQVADRSPRWVTLGVGALAVVEALGVIVLSVSLGVQ